jgi:hypothetical protein
MKFFHNKVAWHLVVKPKEFENLIEAKCNESIWGFKEDFETKLYKEDLETLPLCCDCFNTLERGMIRATAKRKPGRKKR